MSEPVALGLRVHSGWTAAVAVAGTPIKPIVLHRHRIETVDGQLAGARQPYHAAKALSCEAAAETLIRQCRENSTMLAIQGMDALLNHVRENGLTVVATAILIGSGRPLPPLPGILRSHALIHTAEGEFFREVLIAASEHCSLDVTKVNERSIWDTAAGVFGRPVAELQRRLGQLGNMVGPPWRQDEKLASLAAWIALSGLKRAPIK